MTTQSIAVSAIVLEPRKRPVDWTVVATIQKSIEQQGLLQNIGVKKTDTGYRLVFGAHRLEAIKALGWAEIPARVFPVETSDDECLLAELQENNARNDLTGAERKAFAADVGRLCLKLKEMSNDPYLSNLEKNWLMDIVDKTGQARSTVNNWWSAFCKETGLTLTPKQAGDAERKAFFDWLDTQKQAEDAEKQRKEIEAEAEKQRKTAEAKAKRQEAERQDLHEYLDATVQEWGRKLVEQWVKEWLA